MRQVGGLPKRCVRLQSRIPLRNRNHLHRHIDEYGKLGQLRQFVWHELWLRIGQRLWLLELRCWHVPVFDDCVRRRLHGPQYRQPKLRSMRSGLHRSRSGFVVPKRSMRPPLRLGQLDNLQFERGLQIRQRQLLVCPRPLPGAGALMRCPVQRWQQLRDMQYWK